MMRVIAALVVACLLVPPAMAQRTEEARIGAMIRVRLGDSFATAPRGTLVSFDSSGMLLRTEGRDALDLHVPTASILGVQMLLFRRGAGSGFAEGAGKGLKVGLGITAALLLAGAVIDARGSGDSYVSATAVALILGLPITLGTTLLGGAGGATDHEAWTDVPWPPR